MMRFILSNCSTSGDGNKNTETECFVMQTKRIVWIMYIIHILSYCHIYIIKFLIQLHCYVLKG